MHLVRRSRKTQTDSLLSKAVLGYCREWSESALDREMPFDNKLSV